MDDLFAALDGSLERGLESMTDSLDSSMSDLDARIEKAMEAVNRATARVSGDLMAKSAVHSPYVLLNTNPVKPSSVNISMGDRNIPKEHSFSFVTKPNSKVTVRYNNEDDYSIQTDDSVSIDMAFLEMIQRRIINDVANAITKEKKHETLPAHIARACEQAEKMRKSFGSSHDTRRKRKKDPFTISDRYIMEDPGPVENIWSEDFAGNTKETISDRLSMDTKVRVASRPGISAVLMPNHPKYQVFVGDTEVYMRKMEDMMYRSSMMPNTADMFIEAWLKGWTDEEQYFLREALKGVVALRLNRKYHDETLSVLDKRLSKQRDGDGDVGDSVGADGGS